MSKNTASNKFRKVNVDAFDEDNYEDEAVEVEGLAAQITAREAEVRKLLNGPDKVAALHAALRDPPLTTKNEALKAKNAATVLTVLGAFKLEDIAKTAVALNQEELDVLMKYLYRGMSEPDDELCKQLLAWHAAVVAAGGMGTVVRTLTDRGTV